MADSAAMADELQGARLTIHLDRLVANWRACRMAAPGAEAAAVVKADAYGTGIATTVPALWAAGARTFFVALPDEALAARAVAPDADIYILNGLFGGPELDDQRLIPVLGSLEEIETRARAARVAGRRLPAALHIDTGMNRLGLTLGEAERLVSESDHLGALDVRFVMSHLAAADQPSHPLNARQAAAFQQIRALFPGLKTSFANSAGTFLGPAYHGDLIRPGIALYGGVYQAGTRPLQAVVTLEARILQVRTVATGDTVGYGCAQTMQRPTQVAIVAMGYADGYHRRAGSADGAPGARARIEGHDCPILGRVSMDLIALDVTDLPAGLARPGRYARFLDEVITVDEVAGHAQTIGYEILTGLGRRYRRTVLGGAI
jgi:alanine racemase